MQLKKMPDLCKRAALLDIKLYLFGSACRKICPSDIDIIVMYPYNWSQIDEIIKLRNEIVEYLQLENKLPIHVITLSYDEEKEVAFLAKEKGKLIM